MSGQLAPETQYDVAQLLAKIAICDQSIAAEETERLVSALRRGFGLSPGTALELVVRVLDDAPAERDVSTLHRRLDAALDKAQKENLLVMLLEVIAADGTKESREMSMLVSTIAALHMPDGTVDRAYSRYVAKKKTDACG